MPAWPYFWNGAWTYTTGTFGYVQRNQVAGELRTVAEGRAEFLKQIEAMPLADIARNDQLMEVALASGKAVFGDNCAPCHGAGAQGSAGFPNLNDDDWQWGGTLDDIQTTVTHGIRWEADDETRLNQMPRFLKDGILN